LFLQEDWSSSHSLRLYTDAAQSSGFGILFGDQWAYGTWPEKWKRYNICFLEFFPIVIGLSMWCQELRNKRVLFMTDSESLVHVINKQTTKDAMLLGLLRKLGYRYANISNTDSGASASRELGSRLKQLLEASLSSSSVRTYQRPWQLLYHFQQDRLGYQGPVFPLSINTLALFIAFLAEQKYAASTVLTYISAVSYPHRLASLTDPTKADMIQIALRGYSKLNPSFDVRLPISLPILENIIAASDHTQSALYYRKMTQAMYAFAFFAALRVGELTYRTHQSQRNLILLNQITFMETREGSISAIKLTLRNYKHSDTSKPVDIFLYREHPVCPVSLLLAYLNLRGNFPGPLFCWPDASPISRSFFTSALTAALNFCNLDVSKYKSHSFRIGAASWAAAKGFSDAQIRSFGRWNSNAFLRYIRISSLPT
ncbi:unnamed protein product, partial [Porites evermanni]